MHEQASQWENRELDQTEMREVLRRNYFQKHSIQNQNATNSLWRPENIFMGENLHMREYHEGRSLRWTGPSEQIVFYLPSRSAGCHASIHLTPIPMLRLPNSKSTTSKFPCNAELQEKVFCFPGNFKPLRITPNMELLRKSNLRLLSKPGRGILDHLASHFRKSALLSNNFQRSQLT